MKWLVLTALHCVANLLFAHSRVGADLSSPQYVRSQQAGPYADRLLNKAVVVESSG